MGDRNVTFDERVSERWGPRPAGERFFNSELVIRQTRD